MESPTEALFELTTEEERRVIKYAFEKEAFDKSSGIQARDLRRDLKMNRNRPAIVLHVLRKKGVFNSYTEKTGPTAPVEYYFIEEVYRGVISYCILNNKI